MNELRGRSPEELIGRIVVNFPGVTSSNENIDLKNQLEFLLILACPIMHIFMHGRHGHGGVGHHTHKKAR